MKPHSFYPLLALILMISYSTSYAQSYEPFEVSAQTVSGQEIQFLDLIDGVVLPKGDVRFELSLPSPDGKGLTVDLVETTAFPASMKAKYPEIRTYRGYAKESGALVAVLQDSKGISAYVKETSAPSWQIEPIGPARARMGSTLAISGDEDPLPLSCGYLPEEVEALPSHETNKSLQSRQAQVVKRKYILALACTGEFGNYTQETTP